MHVLSLCVYNFRLTFYRLCLPQKQYTFIHDAVAESLTLGPTTILSANLHGQRFEDDTLLQKQFQVI